MGETLSELIIPASLCVCSGRVRAHSKSSLPCSEPQALIYQTYQYLSGSSHSLPIECSSVLYGISRV